MTQSVPSPRIAYLAVNALQDRSSGAAISLLTMMRALAANGWEARALSATVFDRPPSSEALGAMAGEWGLQSRGLIAGTRAPVWGGTVEGVDHTVIHLGAMHRMQLAPLGEALFLQVARRWLQRVRPDIVLTLGGLVLDGALQQAARRQGAAVVFYLANGSYRNAETFADIDEVLTNSELTSRMYAQRLGIQARNVGVFVDTRRFTAADREPQWVTFVNPVAEKGVALFLRLVQMARTRAPGMRFAVVESRGTLAAAIERLKLDPSVAEHVTVLPRQEDMREVYRRTRVLLLPSMWFEAAGRVLVEALANGIPVVATNSGGIPETLGGGGTLVDAPETCRRDFWHLPSDEEAAPWWNALARLHEDSDHYAAESARARAAGAQHELSALAAKLDSILREVLARKARGIPHELARA